MARLALGGQSNVASRQSSSRGPTTTPRTAPASGRAPWSRRRLRSAASAAAGASNIGNTLERGRGNVFCHDVIGIGSAPLPRMAAVALPLPRPCPTPLASPAPMLWPVAYTTPPHLPASPAAASYWRNSVHVKWRCERAVRGAGICPRLWGTRAGRSGGWRACPASVWVAADGASRPLPALAGRGLVDRVSFLNGPKRREGKRCRGETERTCVATMLTAGVDRRS